MSEQHEAQLETKIIFGEEFQLMFLGEILRNNDFAAETIPHVSGGYFSKEVLEIVFNLTASYFSEYGMIPHSKDVILDFAKLHEKQRDAKEYIKCEECQKLVEMLLAKKSNGEFAFNTHPETTIDLSRRFIKKAAVRAALWDSVNLLKNDNYEALSEAISKALTAGAPITASLSAYLKNKHEREQQYTGEFLGYDLLKLRELARKTDGIQHGLIFIYAETNAGKTALLSNLMLDMLDSNPETVALYFSLDDNKDTIINRLISIESQVVINQVQKKQPTEIAAARVRNAYDKLISLTDAKRLYIKDMDEVGTLATLEALVNMHSSENLIVFVDGIYNLDVGKKARGIREDNIERANRIKALADKHRIPIIGTGELRKGQKGAKGGAPSLDDMMESGKYAYNSNLTLLLYPDEPERYETTPDPIIKVKFAKNKLSDFRGEITLRFHRAQGRMEMDAKKTQTSSGFHGSLN